MPISSPTARPSLWHWVGRFILAYLVALVVSTIIVPIGLLTLGPDFPLIPEIYRFAFTAIGVFAILPAIIVFSLVLWLRLPPLRSIVISAGLVGLVGAVMLETDFFERFRPASINIAFVAAMTLCGLIAGLVFWFIAFRGTGFPPRAATATET